MLQRPSEERLRSFLRNRKDAPFSYGEVGASKAGATEGYVVDHSRAELGEGEGTFECAIEALRKWRMFDLGWAGVFPPEAPIEAGAVVGVVARPFGLWSVNPCRIVYVINEERRFGFAYGTLPGHAARGEERFTVERGNGDSVHYDILAFSRPGPLMKLGYPFARSLQRRFARDSLRAMTDTVLC
ncbi:MAG: DUF1990 domain-containing protein [Rubrobacter sp.]|nr:DUF1990 domain-containing protein [Rubrobacter sp.]